MKRSRLIPIAIAATAFAAAGCDEAESDAEERGAKAVELCRGHGGVSALDDDIVICRDESVHQGEV